MRRSGSFLGERPNAGEPDRYVHVHVEGRRRRAGRGGLPLRHQHLRLRREERHAQDRDEGADRMKRLRAERGQVFVLTALSMTILLGMTALVLDVGDWYRTKRQLQATADAAALAGAQALPNDPAKASSLALNYANGNGGGVDPNDISVQATQGAGDTIAVKAKKQEPG